MTLDRVKKLKPGDTVHWDDPDEGICSGDFEIKSITIHADELVQIVATNGDFLQCRPEELIEVGFVGYLW